ncbi:hypothetical protein [uncultured Limnohabitans sp.]|jgi:hypothetical protein|uniref:hypothetical protein n=1 Tax=uncultured Limnohabitans sp. TaxID=768543 RepID=UPI002626CF09|nr:hypothetical protein [uncultured Limnohabitans sp.]
MNNSAHPAANGDTPVSAPTPSRSAKTAPTKKATTKTPPAKTPRKKVSQTASKIPKAPPVKAKTASVVKPAAPAKSRAQTQPKVASSPVKPSQAADKKLSVAPTKAAKAAKEKKIKVVRDSFTLPKTELMQINEMKKRAMALGVEVKKSELIRAGLLAMSGMADAAFKKAMAQVPTIKTGRPAKD